MQCFICCDKANTSVGTLIKAFLKPSNPLVSVVMLAPSESSIGFPSESNNADGNIHASTASLRASKNDRYNANCSITCSDAFAFVSDDFAFVSDVFALVSEVLAAEAEDAALDADVDADEAEFAAFVSEVFDFVSDDFAFVSDVFALDAEFAAAVADAFAESWAVSATSLAELDSLFIASNAS